ncbi:PREDICTED: probable multidrug resistance-associated protein lethal(2)03659 [Papilio polytes]|uniref:probable multidrug resistance-associated protein lethal(2)03659 n=1 Tax=Papilio polytes TaxID=76194 RepID=UPI0006761EDF|nr:PREDICTED: probable multidrug resistance-associated protein lethal(2)03659 [Papilio polytes]
MVSGNKDPSDPKKIPPKNREKKSNNYKRANPVSKAWFVWMMPTFWRGYKRDLYDSDLTNPKDGHLSNKLGDRLEKKWMEEIALASKQGRKPSLLRAMTKAFWLSYAPSGIMFFIQALILKPFQPVALSMLLAYWEPGSTMTYDQAVYCATAVIMMSLLIAFVNHHGTYSTQQFGMKVRIAACSLIYRKVMRMSSGALAQTTAGQVVNLLSNDVNRFDYAFIYTHFIWLLPLQVMLVCYLIYSKIGIAAVVGVVGIVLQTIPVQSYMSKLAARLRMKTACKTDERVRIMDEIINGMQVIKMYAWEKPFEKVVALARKNEIKCVTSASYLRGVYLSFMVFTERLTLYTTLLSYSLLGYQVTADIVFPLAQFYNTLQGTLSIIMSNAVSFLAEALISVQRLEAFMLFDEREDLRSVPDVDIAKLVQRVEQKKNKNLGEIDLCSDTFKKIDEDGIFNPGFECSEKGLLNQALAALPLSPELGIQIQDVSASWSDKGPVTLRNINLTVPKGKLCAIIGSVGSGKSSILQLLLSELRSTQGRMHLSGPLSYACQEPWLFVATVRQNILFGLPYNPKKYKEVVKVCALQKDFQQFPHGDQTLVGERGASLSGGQRARINLARAVYRQADIYLLDDPLSAVDAHVGKQLFNECITGYLRHTTRVLVTHQLHYLKAADYIVIMNNGSIEAKGSYDELITSGKDFAVLLSSLQDENDTNENEKPLPMSRRTSARLSTTRRPSLTESTTGCEIPAQEMEEEQRESGSMGWHVYGAYLRAGGKSPRLIFMVLLLVIGQLSATLCDYWVTFWTNEVTRQKERETNSTMNDYDRPQATANSTFSIMDYFSGIEIQPDLNIHAYIGPLDTAQYLYVYTALIVCCIFFITARAFMFFKVCMTASRNLHNDMFHSMLRGVMRFFDTNSSGRILNRFSKDIGALDELLPRFLLECIQIYLVMFSILALNAAALVWTLLPTTIILLLFYTILQIYLKSAQSIKRLEGTTRSPVFSHMSATLNGISTIRSSGAQQRLITEFDRFQDIHTSTWSSYLASGVTLGFWLDFICVLYLTIVIVAFLVIDSKTIFSGNVGLAISQTLILTGMLQFGVRQTAEVISQMTSVERILQYTHIEREPQWDKGAKETPKGWPWQGRIEFRNCYMKYTPEDLPVLKNLNLVIEKGWKVGIVGRTGAGKSSLISSLFRLAIVEGEVLIDDLDTAHLSLQALRSKISIIPQEPVLFSATVRYNLDPFNNYEDEQLWSALEAVDLKAAIPALDFKVSEGGSNFSLGQRQLVCLARAILRGNRILVLDEATANVDPKTDEFIQRTIRKKFADCTVLTVAHRLNTIMDSDRVMVMDAGRLVEFDHPYHLLNNPNGYFTKMVQETNETMSAQLHQIAKNTFLDSGGVIE